MHSSKIKPNGRPCLEIAMMSIEKPIEIGLQRLDNKWGGHLMNQRGVALDFYSSRFSNEFFGLKKLVCSKAIL